VKKLMLGIPAPLKLDGTGIMVSRGEQDVARTRPEEGTTGGLPISI
jgi:hypothetical protein